MQKWYIILVTSRHYEHILVVYSKLINNLIKLFFSFFFSFTLYSACRKVDRKSSVLRHFAPYFPLNSGGTERRVSPRLQCKVTKIINISFLRIGIGPTTCRGYSHKLMYLRHDWPQMAFYNIYFFIYLYI